jgi:hypothetical protein
MFIYLNSGAAITATDFFTFGTQKANETQAQILVTKSITLNRLFVTLTVAPGGVTSRTFTVRKNAANTTLAVTITGAATTGSNTATPTAFVQGDLISVQTTVSGAPAAAVAAVSVEVT